MLVEWLHCSFIIGKGYTMKKMIWLLTILGVSAGAFFFIFTTKNTPTYLYKIVSVESWQESSGQDSIQLSSMDNDFIHLATEEQVDKIIAKFWPDESEVVVVKLATKKLPGDLRHESNPGGTTKYYHLYNGFIPKKAVVAHEIYKKNIL